MNNLIFQIKVFSYFTIILLISYSWQAMVKRVIIMVAITVSYLIFSKAIQCEQNLSDRSTQIFSLSQNEQIVSTIYKSIELIIDTQDKSVSQSIKKEGTWQGRDLRTMARFVKERSRILIIGAQIGLEAVVLGNIVGFQGSLFLTEPDEKKYKILLKNIHLNKLASIVQTIRIGCDKNNQEIQSFSAKEKLLKQIEPFNFAMINAQNLGECLPTLSEIFYCSQFGVTLIKWKSIQSHFTKDIQIFIDRAIELNFRFYKQEQSEDHCGRDYFQTITKEYLLNIEGNENIWMAPKHINLNSAQ